MWRAGRPKGGATRIPARRLAAIPVCALALAACTTDGQVTGSLISGRGATVAFESIDGPPQPVFQKLVENLASEAVARQVSVISREATPNYRIRGYMAAHLEGKRIHIGWVWDVYDANKRRVLRIASEEPAGRRSGDAWAAADDAMLRRIAQTSMGRIAAFLDPSGRPAAEPGPDPATGGPAIAAAEDITPSASAVSARSPAPARPAQRAGAPTAPGLQAALTLANTRP